LPSGGTNHTVEVNPCARSMCRARRLNRGPGPGV
jgi:hypothetical protein